jgi:hypothetical protein
MVLACVNFMLTQLCYIVIKFLVELPADTFLLIHAWVAMISFTGVVALVGFHVHLY